MPNLSVFTRQFNAQAENDRQHWLEENLQRFIHEVSSCRNNNNVIVYASAFMQEPGYPLLTGLMPEDMNGFMANANGMDFSKPLTLVLHTPGGDLYAAESVVDYLRKMFPAGIEVIVPVMAMSAGTMICLSCDKIIMGKQSQIGQTDPQMVHGSKRVAATDIIEQFDKAKEDILTNPDLARLYAPILGAIDAGMIIRARHVVDYSKYFVKRQLVEYMFREYDNCEELADRASQHFANSSVAGKNAHARRISREEARELSLNVEDLEVNDELQECVLNLYHVLTILFQVQPLAKVVINNKNGVWMKFIPVN